MLQIGAHASPPDAGCRNDGSGGEVAGVSGEVERIPGQGLAELVEAILRPAATASGVESPAAADAEHPLLATATTPAHSEQRRSLPTPPRSDVAAALIGAEAGAAIGLLWFGWTPLMPIAVTLAAAASGPLLVRASRPLRRLLFRHWLRSQLSGPSSP
jgi:hypothetical protein